MYPLLGFVLGSSCLLFIGSPYGFGLGSNWLFYIGVPLIIGIWAQIRVSSAFSRWSKVRASGNITGAECAREILQAAQIRDVDVVETNDFLGDHYDPTKKQLHLSSSVYNTPSVAALGIAAHESGHAICTNVRSREMPRHQDASMRRRSTLAKAAANGRTAKGKL